MLWLIQTLCVTASYKGYAGYDVMIGQKAMQSKFIHSFRLNRGSDIYGPLDDFGVDIKTLGRAQT